MNQPRAVKVVDVQAKIEGEQILINLFKMYNSSTDDSGFSVGICGIQIKFTEDANKLCTILTTREALEDIVAIINAARQPTMPLVKQ